VQNAIAEIYWKTDIWKTKKKKAGNFEINLKEMFLRKEDRSACKNLKIKFKNETVY